MEYIIKRKEIGHGKVKVKCGKKLYVVRKYRTKKLISAGIKKRDENKYL